MKFPSMSFNFVKALRQRDFFGAPGYLRGDILFWFYRIKKWWGQK